MSEHELSERIRSGSVAAMRVATNGPILVWADEVEALESSLAQAQADMHALRRVDEAAEALILSIGYPKNRLLVARYMSAKAALPEHQRKADE